MTEYKDDAKGKMTKTPGGGTFEKVELNPVVTIADVSMRDKAIALHDAAHKKCFITNSVNFWYLTHRVSDSLI